DKKTPEMEEILRRQLNVNFDVIEQNESIAEQEKYDFITFMNDSIQYEEYYLEDLISAFKYVDVDFVTKDEQSERNQYIENVKNITKDEQTQPHQYIIKVQNKYLTMYHRDVIDSNLEVKETNNGYNLDQSEIYNLSLYCQNNQQKKLSVIVPIHNNGTYLED